MQISISTNFPQVQAEIDRVGRQAAFAASKAINDTAKAVRDAMRLEVQRVFDRPTPYITSSVRVTRWASKQDLQAVIEPAYLGGKGVDPAKVLQAEITGGARRFKRFEVALHRAGILPSGYQTVPGSAAPLDAYGNVKGSFIVQLLSYFKAFGEQGYRANMTDRRRAQLAKRKRGPGGYAFIGGAEYFVAYGRLRGGPAQHLHPGIWAKSGTHGVVVKPILMFVRSSTYRPRLNVEELAEREVARVFPTAFDQALEMALRTAR